MNEQSDAEQDKTVFNPWVSLSPGAAFLICKGRALVLSSGVFRRMAVNNYKRSIAAADALIKSENSIASILYSVMVLEAFVNELATISAEFDDNHKNAAVIGTLKRLQHSLSIAEKRRFELPIKYDLIHLALQDAPFDHGKAPYQGFQQLIKIRNRLTHPKAESLVGASADGAILQLRQVGIISHAKNPDTPRAAVDWVCQPSVARWALETSRNMIDSVISYLPACTLKEMLLKTWSNDIGLGLDVDAVQGAQGSTSPSHLE